MVDHSYEAMMGKYVALAKRRYAIGVEKTQMLRERISSVEKMGCILSIKQKNFCEYLYLKIPRELWNDVIEMARVDVKLSSELCIYAESMGILPSIQFFPGEFVVLLRNLNSHNYKIGDPIKIIGPIAQPSRGGQDCHGKKGNMVPTDMGSSRPATNEEIASFIAMEIYEKCRGENFILSPGVPPISPTDFISAPLTPTNPKEEI